MCIYASVDRESVSRWAYAFISMRESMELDVHVRVSGESGIRYMCAYASVGCESMISRDLYAGGPVIQRQCRRTVQLSGELADGGVYVSTAGRLTCKHVIHAVGPVWRGGQANEEYCLHRTVFNSLLAAEQRGVSSIALPAISSGVFGFPVDKSTQAITSAVKDFLKDHPQTRLKKISLVDPAGNVVNAFRKSLGVVFGSQIATTHFGECDTTPGEGKYCFSGRALFVDDMCF